MFPCKRHPTSAIFFANLMYELAPKVEQIIVVTPRVYIPKCLIKYKESWSKWYMDSMVSHENGILIIRPYVLSLTGGKMAGLNALLMQICLYPLLKRIIQENRIEIILGYNMIPEGIVAVNLSRMFKLPVGCWIIGSDIHSIAIINRLNLFLTRKSLESSDMVFSESKDLERTALKLSNKGVKIKTFYKGIKASEFIKRAESKSALAELGLNNDKKYLLFVGRLIRTKGILEVVKSFIEIAKYSTQYELIMIGEKIEINTILSMLRDSMLLDRVHFKGILSYEEVAKYMRACDVLVFPSWSEGLPNVVMEAMASGLPVVTSDVGGITEIVHNGITGIAVPPKQVSILTKAILRMINDENLKRNCTKNAMKLISNEFDVSKNVNKLIMYLQSIKNEKKIDKKSTAS